MGDVEGAARDAAEAVIFDPADPEAKAILGGALLDIGRSADAIACLREAVAGAPADANYRQALSCALEKAHDTDGALQTLTGGSPCARPALPSATLLSCFAYAGGISARRYRLAEQARSLGIADACTFGMSAHALSSLGRHDEAAVAYQDALKLGPDGPLRAPPRRIVRRLEGFETSP